MYEAEGNNDLACSQVVGGMCETVVGRADFINGFGKNVNYRGHLYCL